METKRCRQCGEIKPIKQFRQYYGKSTSTYTICKACEAINSRAKYLRRKGDSATDADKAELDKIEQLYEMQRACGLKPPQRRTCAKGSLDILLESFTEQAQNKSAIPDDLSTWLTVELVDTPEYYIDEVYEQLIETYRPVLKVDANTLKPIYDDTYKEVLDQILERFCDYEDNYYQEDK